jgi:hypothetical protein
LETSETFWLTVLTSIQTVFILAGVVIFMTIPKPGRREFATLGALLITVLLTEVITGIGAHVVHTNMNLVINISELLTFIMIVLMYKKQIHWKNTNTIAYVIIAGYLLFGLVNLFFIQGLRQYNSYTWSVSNVCIIVTSLTYFYVLIQQLPTESITRLPMFWINAAMLIYYSGTFVVYLATDYLVNVLKNDLITTFYFHHFLGLIFYSILWYALWLIRQEHLKGAPSIKI